MTWTEAIIARHIATQTLARKCVVLVDNCNWTGHECDVLAVTTDLRIIDVEVKISRADFKADAHKDKWWHRYGGRYDSATRKYIETPPTPREWPNRVWKHYYAMPADVWRDALLEFMPSPRSGLLLLTERNGVIQVRCERRSTPNKQALRIKPESVMDIARLANLRMWQAYDDLRVARANAAEERRRAGSQAA